MSLTDMARQAWENGTICGWDDLANLLEDACGDTLAQLRAEKSAHATTLDAYAKAIEEIDRLRAELASRHSPCP